MPTTAAPSDVLDAVRSYAVEVGGDVRLVQGAGGNFSVKSDDELWIKASGTRLSRARSEQIFLPMQLSATRAAVLDTEDLAPFTIGGAVEGLRPSIETSLHALLPHRVVLHVHSSGAIAAGLSRDITSAIDRLPSWFGTTTVPYAKPGIRLARAVLAEIGDGGPSAPTALLLRNHGLVAAADDLDTARGIVTAVQAAFADRPAPVRITGDPEDGWAPLHPAGTVTETEAELLLRGPYTPDQAVFMGLTPFMRLGADEPAALAAIGSDGSVRLRDDAGEDESEIAVSAVDVARLAHDASATPLSTEQVDELINWEAEKWRRRLKR